MGKIKAIRGKVHDYLAMVLNFTVPGQVKVNMTDYIKSMVEDYEEIEPIDSRKSAA